MQQDVIVVGGGVSGLSTAFWLRQERPELRVTLLEAGESAGGNVTSTIIDGFTIDAGPSSLRPGAPDTMALLEALNLTSEVVRASPAARRRYLVLRGSLLPLPGSPAAALGTPLLSAAGKLRVLAEPLIATGLQGDESVFGFLGRRFGHEAAKRFGVPLVSGLVAGDPQRLSVGSLFPGLVALERRYGSVLRGLIAQQRAARRASPDSGGGATEAAADRDPFTLQGGLGSLSGALAAALGPVLRTNSAVTALRKRDHGYEVTLASGRTQAARHVVLATPAKVSARLLAAFSPEAAAELHGIAYANVGVVTLAYARATLPPLPEGFGFLAAGDEGLRSLGVQFSSATFPCQAPNDAVLLRAIAGGSSDPEFLDLSDDAAIAAVRHDLETTLGITSTPLLAHYRRLPYAIPQYEVGHAERVKRIESQLGVFGDLHLVGNAYRGVGVNDCLQAARELAEGLAWPEVVGS